MADSVAAMERAHRAAAPGTTSVVRDPKVVVVGNPNVGKSVLFNRLTGLYVTVSNYPGTTVEVSIGKIKLKGGECEIVDTPGMYSLLPLTEEERVARKILFESAPDVVMHVIDAKLADRMLPLTLQLIDTGLPLVVAVNMMDEARELGVKLDTKELQQRLGCPVVPLVATTGEGLDSLMQCIELRAAREGRGNSPDKGEAFQWPLAPENERLARMLSGTYPISHASLAMLLLQGDAEVTATVKSTEGPSVWEQVETVLSEVRRSQSEPVEYLAAVGRRRETEDILQGVFSSPARTPSTFAQRLSEVMMRPLTGLPILALVLYFGLYKLVGGVGAGTIVDFLEGTIFEGYVNPFFVNAVSGIVPWAPVQELLVGEYGILTLGLRYALALILPIVAIFFMVFAIIEDSGYLPRLAMLIDRSFKKIGLSGRAVIPLVLGFGCDTMATMVTRTLPTVRERIISTILLSLAIPCSAQLGVILALLQGKPIVAAIWAAVVALVFLAVGFLAARIMPGAPPVFYMEIPPLRLPRFRNVLAKTYARLEWYMKEIIPLFLLASVLIWAGQITGLFDLLVRALTGPVHLIGLPSEAAEMFLFGFFRRDYGAAGLYDLQKQGLLTSAQLAVSCVALTLFLPCVAQFLINVKERGLKTGFAMSGLVLTLSFGVAYALNVVLQLTGLLS